MTKRRNLDAGTKREQDLQYLADLRRHLENGGDKIRSDGRKISAEERAQVRDSLRTPLGHAINAAVEGDPSMLAQFLSVGHRVPEPLRNYLFAVIVTAPWMDREGGRPATSWVQRMHINTLYVRARAETPAHLLETFPETKVKQQIAKDVGVSVPTVDKYKRGPRTPQAEGDCGDARCLQGTQRGNKE
jgi:hypothetical protein